MAERLDSAPASFSSCSPSAKDFSAAIRYLSLAVAGLTSAILNS